MKLIGFLVFLFLFFVGARLGALAWERGKLGAKIFIGLYFVWVISLLLFGIYQDRILFGITQERLILYKLRASPEQMSMLSISTLVNLFYFAVILLLLILIVLYIIYIHPLEAEERKKIAEERKNQEQKRIALIDVANEKHQELLAFIQQNFLVQPCFNCYEFEMQLLDISPNNRSIQYQCVHCGKKMRAAAGTPRAAQLSSILDDTKHAYEVSRQLTDSLMFGRLKFYTVPTPMPYEQSTRTPIPEAIRTEVWRRDRGCCVKCGSKENLQFDHIIPVSRGGATSVKNLQLLCQSCNLSKGTEI